MDRKRRIAMRKYPAARNLNEAARSIDKAMAKAGIPQSDKGAFLDWIMARQWKSFKEERMNRRQIIENEIRDLGLRFPNGTVGKDYYTTFTLPVDKISDIELVGAQRIGLSLIVDDSGNCTLEGRPAQTGDFILTLRYTTIPGEPPSELKMPVAFNPDPRSLWRNIPSDQDVEYAKPDSDKKYVKVEAGADGMPRKDIVAASQRGRSHAREGKPRDDHFSLLHCDKSDWYVMAVADGAGSARYSRKGSEVACKTVVDHCQSLLADNPAFESAISEYAADRNDTTKRTALTKQIIDIILGGALKAHDAVKRVAEKNESGTVLKDFATTLMFAICKRYEFGWFVASFWVGDGAMCLYDKDTHTAKLLGTPDEGEFSGQTRFLTMPEIFRDKDVVAKRLRMTIVKDFTALLLMTDGVSDPMFETDRNLNDYNKWAEFLYKLKTGFPADGIAGVDLSDDNEDTADRLLGWLDFWSPGNHDDRTIAILY